MALRSRSFGQICTSGASEWEGQNLSGRALAEKRKKEGRLNGEESERRKREKIEKIRTGEHGDSKDGYAGEESVVSFRL